MSEFILKTHQLTKQYGKQRSNDSINLTIKKGEIYGLIGKNGAGKTTLIRMITGLIHPTSGSMELFGQSEQMKVNAARQLVGSLIETPTFYDQMTARENLELSRLVRGIPGKACIDEALELVGLQDLKKKKVKDYSLGMKQRLGIAMALLGDPQFLILDEPINGLDPMGIVEMRELLKKVNVEKGMTILISSHLLGELSELATGYGIIHDGKLIEEITAEKLQEKCRQYIELKVDDVSKTTVLLEQQFGIVDYQVLANQLIKVYSHLDLVAQINSFLSREDILIESIQLKGDNLENYFIQAIGGTIHA